MGILRRIFETEIIDPDVHLRAIELIQSKGVNFVFTKDYPPLFKKGDHVIGGRNDSGGDCGYYVKKKDCDDTLWIDVEYFKR